MKAGDRKSTALLNNPNDGRFFVSGERRLRRDAADGLKPSLTARQGRAKACADLVIESLFDATAVSQSVVCWIKWGPSTFPCCRALFWIRNLQPDAGPHAKTPVFSPHRIIDALCEMWGLTTPIDYLKSHFYTSTIYLFLHFSRLVKGWTLQPTSPLNPATTCSYRRTTPFRFMPPDHVCWSRFRPFVPPPPVPGTKISSIASTYG